jgi:hypothetical protein
MNVFAKIKNGFEKEVQEIHITKEETTIILNKKEWKELVETLKGNRKCFYSELEEGEYQPKMTFVFNHK